MSVEDDARCASGDCGGGGVWADAAPNPDGGSLVFAPPQRPGDLLQQDERRRVAHRARGLVAHQHQVAGTRRLGQQRECLVQLADRVDRRDAHQVSALRVDRRRPFGCGDQRRDVGWERAVRRHVRPHHQWVQLVGNRLTCRPEDRGGPAALCRPQGGYRVGPGERHAANIGEHVVRFGDVWCPHEYLVPLLPRWPATWQVSEPKVVFVGRW